jgi:hypothetical protein
MKHFLILSLLLMTQLIACTAKGSQLVVLYRGSVDPGNSIVSFINNADETGQFATSHCEELRHLYEIREKTKYFCSTVVFEAFKPAIK